MAATDIVLSSTLKPPSGVNPNIVIAGEAITAGMAVYRNPADGKYYKALATSVNSSNVAGIALDSAVGVDQPFLIFTGNGDLSNVSGLTVGAPYFLSETTAGSLMRVADVGSTDYICFCGSAKSATIFSAHFYTNGIQHA